VFELQSSLAGVYGHRLYFTSAKLTEMRKTLGLILKKQNYGETDRIITIFSPDLGKKRIIAKAVRRPTSKLAGHLDTFMLSQLMLTDNEDLPRVTSAVLAEPFEDIRTDLQNTERAFAITKVIERAILEDVSQRAIFQITLDALARLNSGQSWTTTWIYFLSELANELGLGPGDFICRQCRAKLTGGGFWDFTERQFVCRSCLGEALHGIYLEENSVKLLQLLRKNQFMMIARVSIPVINARHVEELLLREITQWFNKPWDTYRSLHEEAL
jgi:DNA repair protein RecO (recombination protein O)